MIELTGSSLVGSLLVSSWLFLHPMQWLRHHVEFICILKASFRVRIIVNGILPVDDRRDVLGLLFRLWGRTRRRPIPVNYTQVPVDIRTQGTGTVNRKGTLRRREILSRTSESKPPPSPPPASYRSIVSLGWVPRKERAPPSPSPYPHPLRLLIGDVSSWPPFTRTRI